MPQLPSRLTYRPAGTDRELVVELEGDCLSVSSGSAAVLRARVGSPGERDVSLFIEREDAGSGLGDRARLAAGEFLLGHREEAARIAYREECGSSQAFDRGSFFQLLGHWTPNAARSASGTSDHWAETQGRLHPVRPPMEPGIHYRRYVPRIGKTLSFRRAEVARDLRKFHDWHHQPRVAEFWELAKPMTELEEYLGKGLRDPHQTPMILELDGEAVGYFEVYWTAEDRLGPYYDAGPFDRGFHFLIGEERFLGYDNTDAAIRSVCHFLFLAEPRTRRVMAEPRHDNARVLKYAEASRGWRKLKEFDFHHKRAALLECARDAFFGGNCL